MFAHSRRAVPISARTMIDRPRRARKREGNETNMSTTESIKKYTMPCALLQETVAFPGIPMTVDTTAGGASKRALEAAAKEGTPIFLVCQRDPKRDATSVGDLFSVGVIARVKQIIKTQRGLFRALIEPQARAVVSDFHDEKIQYVDILEKTVVETETELHTRALMRELGGLVDELEELSSGFSKEFRMIFSVISDLGQACDFIAENLLPETADKQAILEEFSPCARAKMLIGMLESEKDIMEERVHIKREVEERMKQNQRDYFLREQMKVIREELGEGEEEFEDEKGADQRDSPPLPHPVRLGGEHSAAQLY